MWAIAQFLALEPIEWPNSAALACGCFFRYFWLVENGENVTKLIGAMSDSDDFDFFALFSQPIISHHFDILAIAGVEHLHLIHDIISFAR